MHGDYVSLGPHEREKDWTWSRIIALMIVLALATTGVHSLLTHSKVQVFDEEPVGQPSHYDRYGKIAAELQVALDQEKKTVEAMERQEEADEYRDQNSQYETAVNQPGAKICSEVSDMATCQIQKGCTWHEDISMCFGPEDHVIHHYPNRKNNVVVKKPVKLNTGQVQDPNVKHVYIQTQAETPPVQVVHKKSPPKVQVIRDPPEVQIVHEKSPPKIKVIHDKAQVKVVHEKSPPTIKVVHDKGAVKIVHKKSPAKVTVVHEKSPAKVTVVHETSAPVVQIVKHVYEQPPPVVVPEKPPSAPVVSAQRQGSGPASTTGILCVHWDLPGEKWQFVKCNWLRTMCEDTTRCLYLGDTLPEKFDTNTPFPQCTKFIFYFAGHGAKPPQSGQTSSCMESKIGSVDYPTFYQQIQEFRKNHGDQEVLAATSACFSTYLLQHKAYANDPFPLITVANGLLGKSGAKGEGDEFPTWNPILDIMTEEIGFPRQMVEQIGSGKFGRAKRFVRNMRSKVRRMVNGNEEFTLKMNFMRGRKGSSFSPKYAWQFISDGRSEFRFDQWNLSPSTFYVGVGFNIDCSEPPDLPLVTTLPGLSALGLGHTQPSCVGYFHDYGTGILGYQDLTVVHFDPKLEIVHISVTPQQCITGAKAVQMHLTWSIEAFLQDSIDLIRKEDAELDNPENLRDYQNLWAERTKLLGLQAIQQAHAVEDQEKIDRVSRIERQFREQKDCDECLKKNAGVIKVEDVAKVWCPRKGCLTPAMGKEKCGGSDNIPIWQPEQCTALTGASSSKVPNERPKNIIPEQFREPEESPEEPETPPTPPANQENQQPENQPPTQPEQPENQPPAQPEQQENQPPAQPEQPETQPQQPPSPPEKPTNPPLNPEASANPNPPQTAPAPPAKPPLAQQQPPPLPAKPVTPPAPKTPPATPVAPPKAPELPQTPPKPPVPPPKVPELPQKPVTPPQTPPVKPVTPPAAPAKPVTPPAAPAKPATPPAAPAKPATPPAAPAKPATPPAAPAKPATPPANPEQPKTPPANPEQPQNPPANPEEAENPEETDENPDEISEPDNPEETEETDEETEQDQDQEEQDQTETEEDEENNEEEEPQEPEEMAVGDH